MNKFSVLVIIACAIGKGSGETCSEPIQHYQDLKQCVPQHTNREDNCPSYYNCDGLFSRPKDKCYYNGRAYKIGEILEQNNLPCGTKCVCTNSQGRGKFSCTYTKCEDFFGPPLGLSCVRQYSLNQCCSTGMACPPFGNLTKCKIGNNEYIEGQRFSPPNNSNLKCLCLPGFSGQYVEPFCHTSKFSCKTELYHTLSMHDHCAPVYIHKSAKCPGYWICPSSDDSIISSSTSVSTGHKCKFGHLSLQIGDIVKKDLYSGKTLLTKRICECRIPPFLTCKHVSKRNW